MSEEVTRERLKKSMTIDDALNVLRDTNAYGTMDIAKSVILDYFAALSEEPMDDLISRDAVLDACSQSINILDAMSRIEDLPSVTPKQRTGHWIYGEDNLGTGRDGWYCNQCGHFEFLDYSLGMKNAKLNLPNPCPNCGAKMEEQE